VTGPRESLRAGVWTREVLLWWHHYNREYLNDALRAPIVELVPGLGPLGLWDRERRRIQLRLEHVAEDPWQDAMATLRHEMAHQAVDEVLLRGHERPHGPSFAQACQWLRVEASATSSGADPVAAGAEDETARLTRRISKLLALGASPNEHEATAAVRLARGLMLEHNLDVVQRDAQRGFGRRVLGPVAKRHHAFENQLAVILSEFFFVEVLWSMQYDQTHNVSGTALFVHGTPGNLEMASYVHGYLWELLPMLWDEHRRAREIRGNRDRLTYFEGVLNGFLSRLREEERARRNTERALVWRGDPKLDEYFRWHNPRVRTVRSSARVVGEAYTAGQEAGRNVRIHRPIEERGNGVAGYLS